MQLPTTTPMMWIFLETIRALESPAPSCRRRSLHQPESLDAAFEIDTAEDADNNDNNNT
jgi:hypothetical protein